MLEQLLRTHGGELIAAVTRNSNLDQSQAESLVPPALGQIEEAIRGSGPLELMSLLRGEQGLATVLEQVDLGRIAGEAGVSEGEAREGLTGLVPALTALLGGQAGGGLNDILASFGGTAESGGGLRGVIGNLAGRFFNR